MKLNLRAALTLAALMLMLSCTDSSGEEPIDKSFFNRGTDYLLDGDFVITQFDYIGEVTYDSINYPVYHDSLQSPGYFAFDKSKSELDYAFMLTINLGSIQEGRVISLPYSGIAGFSVLNDHSFNLYKIMDAEELKCQIIYKGDTDYTFLTDYNIDTLGLALDLQLKITLELDPIKS